MKLLVGLLVLTLLSCCGSAPPKVPGTVKIYSIQEQKGGLVRSQANEVKPFSSAKGYLCASPQHTSDIINCVGGGVRIYSLQPSLNGIYRKQANELKTYADARGYFCVSPADFGQIQDNCK
jgi:hypothetical protein